MKILIVGATGATGQHLVKELLQSGNQVVALVRAAEKLPASIRDHQGLSIVLGAALDLSDEDLEKLITDCDAVASCLGHNLTFKGIFGRPRRLVAETIARLCRALSEKQSATPAKIVLMNTAGNCNSQLGEKLTARERFLDGLLRWFLPPHADNLQAARYLQNEIGDTHPKIQWVVVRPDTLINDDVPSRFEIHSSPIRSALFNPGKTSRINVAHFMAQLITNEETWNQWKGKMPVIYNVEVDK